VGNGSKVKSSNGKTGVCVKHGGAVYRAPSGMTTCIKCNRVFKPMARENSCNYCVSPVAVAKRIKSAEKRRLERV
jgi:rRNA maturation endonuclease Nob1